MLLRCSVDFSVFVIFTTIPLLVASRNCNGNGDHGPRPNPPDSEHAVLSHIENPIPDNQLNQLQKPRNRCCPYDFDSSLCRMIDERLLCGFNRNVGHPESKDVPIDLQGGCRLRGGRLECGYEQGPYTNIRRPPAWYDASVDKGEEIHSEDKSADRVVSDEGKLNRLKLYHSPSTQKYKVVTRCVEIRERIVCKDMKS